MAGFHVAGVYASFWAVMRTRTAQGAVAWAISLIAIPYVAIPLYLVFGRNKFEGYVTARRVADREVGDLGADLDELVARVKTWNAERPELHPLEQLVRLPFTKGNRASLLINGEQTFASIFESIREAKRYVLVQYYTVRDDQLGREFRDLLVSKAKEGVRVYFLYDEIGSEKLVEYGEILREAGVEFRPFYSNRGRTNRFQINFRNHRKIVIADGRVAFLGGLNLGDEYLGRSSEMGFWRDTHVKIEGPAVIPVQLSFIEDWSWSGADIPPLQWEPQTAVEPGASTLILPTGPSDTLETCGLFFTQIINSAQKRLWISSPYFVPDGKIMSALFLAVLRGVDVRIIIPEKADHTLVWLAAYYYLRFAVPNGIKAYRYQRGFLHQKALLVDDDISAVGTANFDNRSFRLNFEITALFQDREFAEKVSAMFEEDFAQSRRIQVEDYDRRSGLFKVSVAFARLFAPVL